MTDEIKKMPRVSASAFIQNSDGRFLLIRSPKWHDKLTLVGGHVNYGEGVEDACKREVMEEVGLKIKDLELIGVFDLNNDPEYIPGGHAVGVRYIAHLDGDEQEIKIDGMEAKEFYWLTLDEIEKRDDVVQTIKEMILVYKQKFHSKRGLFHRACRDCEKYKKESEEFKAGWQRALADYKNLQREVEQRRGEWAQMSEAQIIEEFLPVYENMKKAMTCDTDTRINADVADNADKRFENWKIGVEHIKKQFAEVLKQHGVEEIKTVGEKFDPMLHEAGGDEEVEGKESGEILREVSGGYKMGGKVIRAARVIVCK